MSINITKLIGQVRSRSLLEDLPSQCIDQDNDWVPWFKDFDKLLAAVVLRANQREDWAKKLICAAADVASQEKKLRGLLSMKIRADSIGAMKGPSRVSDVTCVCIAQAYSATLKHTNYTKQRALEAIGELYPGALGARSAKQVKRLVERGQAVIASYKEDGNGK